MPALPTNLFRVGAVYKFRSRVPTDLLRYYSPKREFTESLHTKSLTEARRLLPAVQLKYQQEWANLRAAMTEGFTDLVLNDTGIQYLVAVFEHESLAGDDAIRNAGHYDIEEIREYRERLSESISFLRDAAAIRDLAAIKPALEEYLRLKKLRPVGRPEDFDCLAFAYLQGAIRTNEALLARMRGDAVPLSNAPSPPPNRKLHAIPAGDTHTSLYSLFEYWRDAVPGRPQKTIDDYEKRVRAFDALTRNKLAEQLVKADFVAYRDARLKKVAPQTVEKDLSFLKAIMQFAFDSDKLPANPAAGIKVAKNEMSSLPRDLDADDLTTLFNSGIYARARRPRGGSSEAAAWLPLMALYTGARLEELCQLTLDDIKTEARIPYLRIIDLIDENADKLVKRLKNVGSRRSIPIPQQLIDHGFLKYVRHLRKQEQTWLFPDLTVEKKYGRRGANWSKWWGRWRKTLNVSGREKCFHAFRHVFKSACRAAGVGEDIHDAITGHSGGGVGRDYGKFPLEALKPAIDKVSYLDLKFAWFWTPPEAASRAAHKTAAG
jgi:integrase